MSCVLSLAFCIILAMNSGVDGAHANSLLTLKPPLWYQQAEQCCNHELTLRDEDEHTYDIQLFRECFDEQNNASPYSSCQPDLCYAIKKGYASADGTIHKEILKLLLEVELEHNLETYKKILADCVYGDFSKYPMVMQLCEMKRMNECITVHIQEEVIRECNDWKDNFYCLKMRLELTKNIRKYL